MSWPRASRSTPLPGRDTFFIDYISPNFISEKTNQDFEALNARLKLLWEPAEIPRLYGKADLFPIIDPTVQARKQHPHHSMSSNI